MMDLVMMLETRCCASLELVSGPRCGQLTMWHGMGVTSSWSSAGTLLLEQRAALAHASKLRSEHPSSSPAGAGTPPPALVCLGLGREMTARRSFTEPTAPCMTSNVSITLRSHARPWPDDDAPEFSRPPRTRG